MKQVSTGQVKLFLKEFKTLVREGRFTFYGRKRKNWETLAELGISLEECIEHLLSLKPEDFVGVTDDANVCAPDGWVFRKRIQGKMIYIRLRLDTENGMAICESFHF